MYTPQLISVIALSEVALHYNFLNLLLLSLMPRCPYALFSNLQGHKPNAKPCGILNDAVLPSCIYNCIFNYDCYRLDNKSHGRGSMSSDPKAAPESDTDSMAEYGDGDTGL